MRKNQVIDDLIHNDGPNILTIDIETSPIIAYTWGPKYETNLVEFVEHGKILCYSAKWLTGKQETKGLIDYAGYKPGVVDDKRIMYDIYKLLNQADIVVTQNGKAFDLKYINTRLLAHGIPPPSPYKVVDTRTEARKYLRLPSNSLEDLGQYFLLGKKHDHKGFQLWVECMAGNKKSWKTMLAYNAQDTRLTEQVYLKIRPFMKTHPNIGSHAEGEVCGKCGSYDLQRRGSAVNLNVKYWRYQCLGCGGWSRSQIKDAKFKVLPNI